MEKIQWILWQEPQDRAGLHSRLVNIYLRNSSREVGSDNRARDASVSRAPVKFSISFTLIMLIYSKLQILRVATTTYHYHNDFKFYLQLNVYASLSREWIDFAWLNVMVCVWRSTKTSKIENFLGFDPTCFQTSSGADERIDIGSKVPYHSAWDIGLLGWWAFSTAVIVYTQDVKMQRKGHLQGNANTLLRVLGLSLTEILVFWLTIII